MKNTTDAGNGTKRSLLRPVFKWAILGALLTVSGGKLVYAQNVNQISRGVVQFDQESFEIKRFAVEQREPGPGKKSYREAMVIKIRVLKSEFDNLPPALSPMLFIGKASYPIYRIERDDRKKHLVLVFRVKDWSALEEGVGINLSMPHLQHNQAASAGMSRDGRTTRKTYHKRSVVDTRAK